MCPLCDRLILDPLDRSDCDIDHVIPRAHGGSDARYNLQLSHITCNREKGCGCPLGQHVPYEQLVQMVWRKQEFKCALCQGPILPSDVLRSSRAKLVDGALSHLACIEDHYRARKRLSDRGIIWTEEDRK